MAIKIWGTESVVRSSGDAALQDAVTLLGDGGYVVTWSEAGKIYFQRYDGLGQKDGLPVDTGATSIIAATFADVQSIGVDGGFVITWTQETGTTVKTETLLSKRFNYDGTEAGPAIQVASSSDVKHGAKLAAGDNGGWSTVFVDNTGATPTVKLKTYDASGTLSKSVDVAAGGTPSVAYTGDGKYAVAYTSGGTWKYSVVDANGTVTASTASFSAYQVDEIVALKNGDGSPSSRFIILAEKNSSAGIDAYLCNADGTFVDPAHPSINVTGPNSVSDLTATASVTSLKNGGFAVAYMENNGGDLADVFVRVFDRDGIAADPPLLVNQSSAAANNGEQRTPSISEMADGRLAITWTDPTLGKSLVATSVVDARTAHVTVAGTSHDDIYVGSDFDGDNLDGAGGNDLLIGGLGADVLKGGAGIDTASFQYATADVTASLATGGSGGEANGDTYTEIENLLGSDHYDHLTGDDNANTLMGGAGNDTLVGGGGVDRLDGGAGSDTVSYAERSGPVTVDLANGIAPDGDVLVSIENVEGTGGDDIFYGSRDIINVFTGGLGNDTYVVQNTGDYIVEGANAGTDTVNTIVSYTLSANVENLIAGGTDAISLTGNDLNNVITGNSGDNVINGGLGADVMSGGAGNDIYYADNAGDVINDSSGNDTVVVSGNVSLANFVGIENIMLSATGDISLDGNEFGNTVTGNNGANVLNGLGGDDVLEGLGGNDVLYGGDGNDLLKGGDGLDVLYGLAGNDTLYGGAGKDTLYGGTGKDVFVFDTRANKSTNLDRVADFSVKDDSIWLDNAVFSNKIGKGTPTSPRKLSKSFFKLGTKAGDKDDYFIYNKAKATLYYDIDGSGKKAMVEIAKFDKKPNLTINDLFVI